MISYTHLQCNDRVSLQYVFSDESLSYLSHKMRADILYRGRYVLSGLNVFLYEYLAFIIYCTIYRIH